MSVAASLKDIYKENLCCIYLQVKEEFPTKRRKIEDGEDMELGDTGLDIEEEEEKEEDLVCYFSYFVYFIYENTGTRYVLKYDHWQLA